MTIRGSKGSKVVMSITAGLIKLGAKQVAKFPAVIFDCEESRESRLTKSSKKWKTSLLIAGRLSTSSFNFATLAVSSLMSTKQTTSQKENHEGKSMGAYCWSPRRRRKEHELG